MIHLWIQKLIGSQNQDGSFISEFDGVEGEGLLDGAAMIVCSLVEAYRFFREERILQSLTDWLNYTEKNLARHISRKSVKEMRINHLIWQMVKPVCYWQNGMFCEVDQGQKP